MARRKTHPGSIETLPSGSVRVRMSVGGTMRRFTLGQVSQGEAEVFAREKFRQLTREAERVQAGLPGRIRFSELLQRFKSDYVPALAPNTRAAYTDSLKPVRAYFVKELGDLSVETIQAAHVRGYLTWRRVHGPRGEKRSRPLSNRTLQKDRAVLHRIFAVADELEIRDGNPVARVGPPKHDGREAVILTEAEYDRLIDACTRPMLRLWALVLGETGVRCDSEGLHFQWQDVDLEEGFLWVSSGRDGHRTKSGKGRWIPMTPRLRAAMRVHFAEFRFAAYNKKRSPWVFHHLRSRGTAKAGDRIKSFRAQFNEARSSAKLPAGFVPHDLRHRRVTTWLADEKNPVHVMEAMGHSDLRTTMGYTHLARRHLQSLVAPSPERGGLQHLTNG